MFKTMLQKAKSKKGFTLMEMLIVVAIIAILVVIAFPVFNNSLTSAKQAADDANERSAKAVATTAYLTVQAEGTGNAPVVGDKFDAAKGTLVSSATAVSPGYGKTDANKGKILVVKTAANGVYTFEWAAAS